MPLIVVGTRAKNRAVVFAFVVFYLIQRTLQRAFAVIKKTGESLCSRLYLSIGFSYFETFVYVHMDELGRKYDKCDV